MGGFVWLVGFFELFIFCFGFNLNGFWGSCLGGGDWFGGDWFGAFRRSEKNVVPFLGDMFMPLALLKGFVGLLFVFVWGLLKQEKCQTGG